MARRWRDRDVAEAADSLLLAMAEQERLYAGKTSLLRAKKAYKQHLNGSAFLDWFAVFVGVTSFVFLVLWAAAPDSQGISFYLALERAVSYGGPITFGMWAVSRATRKASYVPKGMAEQLPYARFNKSGKLETSTQWDDDQGNPPTPMGGGTSDGDQS